VVDDELELIRRVRMGDKDAFAELLRPLVGAAARLAYGLLQDRCAVEDCVQEASMRAWLRIENLEIGRSFRPWFLGIVTNRCREELRGRWRSVVRFAIPLPDHGGRTDGGEDEWLAGADLRRALTALPHRQRETIVLHFYLDLPLEEVAATLGLGIPGVKSNVNRGLRRLRQALKAERL
jgi:RNA polymerase sigma factor (sigma-70 family)